MAAAGWGLGLGLAESESEEASPKLRVPTELFSIRWLGAYDEKLCIIKFICISYEMKSYVHNFLCITFDKNFPKITFLK